MRRDLVAAAAAIALPAMAGCVPSADSGYVEIKVVPVSAVPALYLDSTRLDPVKGGSAVLRQKVGTAKLQMEMASGQVASLCEVVVKKDRITTVTVSALDRPPRCQCKHADGSRACVG